MTADLKTLETAWVGATTRFEKWRDNFERDFMASTMEDMMKMMVASMPPGMVDEVERMDPAIKPVIDSLQGG